MNLSRLALAAALLLPAACGSWNPLVAVGIRSEPAHKPTPLEPIKAAVTPRVVWTVNVGKSGAFQFRPDVEGGRVFAAAADGNLTIVEADSGRVVSRVETKKRLSGGVEAADGKVLVGTEKGEVMALDAAGKVIWSVAVAGEVISPPALTGDVVVVRTSDGRIVGLSATDGKRLWVYQRPMPALMLRTASGVLTTGGDVVAGYPNGKLIALDAQDGKLTWEATVSLPRGATELERVADVAGLPVIDGDRICAAAYQGKVACFELKTRNVLWSRDISSSRSLGRDANQLYLVDPNGAVHALDRISGASMWKQEKLAHRRLSAPVVHQGRVVVGDGFGFLHVLSPEDGAIVGRLELDKTAVQSIVPAGDGLVVQTAGGSLSLVRF